MSEYIEREAAIDAVKKERNYTGKFTFEEEHAWAVGFQQGITFALSDIAVIPAADVREVKRCKDCIYAYPYGLEIKCTKHSGHSEKFGEDASYSEFHDWNWFCADAQERRKK